MGAAPNKEKIFQILEQSITNPFINEEKNLRIEYKQIDSIEFEENETVSDKKEDAKNDSFTLSNEEEQILTSQNLKIINIKKFPYNAIGTISVIFPVSEKYFVYTCFLININVIVTLAVNLYDKNKGGKARRIITSFSKEDVKWENIHIQKENNKNRNETPNNVLNGINTASKLAVILYDDNISNEWIGVEGGKKEDFDERDLAAVFSFNEKVDNIKNKKDVEDQENNSYSVTNKFKEIFITKENPFLDIYNKGTKSEKELINQSQGSPLYYRDYNNGAYVVAIINQNYEFQYFDKMTMLFLIDMVNKGKLLRKKINKEIDEDNIVKLNLQRNNFGPSDAKYLTNFELKNLRILDLSDNSIKSQGVFYLSQVKFISLENLNLSFNNIGDEGLYYITNGFFNRLNNLNINHNNISSYGMKFLVKSVFVDNLVFLSLHENPNIGDNGIKIMKEHKGWGKLIFLGLNSTGLTDKGLGYLGEAFMPKLKNLDIQGNKFTEKGRVIMKTLNMNNIHVGYRIEAEKIKEKERDNYKIKELE